MFHQHFGAFWNCGYQVFGDFYGTHENRRWHMAAATLNFQQALHRLRLEGIASNAINRVGGENDTAA